MSNAARIHVVHEHPNPFEVWIDTEFGVRDGVCIGAGDTREAAIAQAKLELTEQLVALETLSPTEMVESSDVA